MAFLPAFVDPHQRPRDAFNGRIVHSHQTNTSATAKGWQLHIIPYGWPEMERTNTSFVKKMKDLCEDATPGLVESKRP